MIPDIRFTWSNLSRTGVQTHRCYCDGHCSASFPSQALADGDASSGHRMHQEEHLLLEDMYIHAVATRMYVSLYSSFTRSTVDALGNGLHQAVLSELSDTDFMSDVSI